MEQLGGGGFGRLHKTGEANIVIMIIVIIVVIIIIIAQAQALRKFEF